MAQYVHKYETTSNATIDLGLKALGADNEISAQVTMSKGFTLALDLRGGYDYEMRRLVTGVGIAWT